MAGSVTLTPEAHAATSNFYGGAGSGQHLPVGVDWLGSVFASALRFAKPSWTGLARAPAELPKPF